MSATAAPPCSPVPYWEGPKARVNRGRGSVASHRRIDAVCADGHEARRERAIVSALGGNKHGRPGLQVRLGRGTERDDRDAVGDRDRLLPALYESLRVRPSTPL